jgi:type IV secretory pathway ATPase VirB11/archaellum biosynthesis ATPase
MADFFGLDNPAIQNRLADAGILPLLSTRDQRVIDIMVNGPGEMFLQIAGQPGYKRQPNKAITMDWAIGLCSTLSAATDGGYDRDAFPMLLSDLAGGHRFTALTGKGVTGNGIAISIRVRRDISLPLSTFGLDERAEAKFRRSAKASQLAIERSLPVVERLKCIIARKGNILISGGTGTGKTTLFNSLAELIPDNERPITVEDVREIELKQPNHLTLKVARKKGRVIEHRDIIDSILRLNPDRILISELSVDNAAPAFRLANSGHGGLMLTVHANDPLEALEAWRRNYELSEKMGGETVVNYLARNIDAIIQVDFDDEDPAQQCRRSTVVFRGDDGTLDMPWRELLGVGQAGVVDQLSEIAHSMKQVAESLKGRDNEHAQA